MNQQQTERAIARIIEAGNAWDRRNGYYVAHVVAPPKKRNITKGITAMLRRSKSTGKYEWQEAA